MTDVAAAIACSSPQALRQAIRAGQWRAPTAGLAPGFVQANLVVLPRAWADEFLLFCQRNPKPCPLLEVTHEGSWEPTASAPGADLRRDIPLYHVYRHGELIEQRTDILERWQADFVAFLLGCSFTFEEALMKAGIPVRHIQCGRNAPVYRTHIACEPAGRLHGLMAVSMRPIPAHLVETAIQITARYPAVHGAPVHVGDPAAIGIHDLLHPDYGDPPDMQPGDVPVFWACGVTPQAVAVTARPELMITHAPGHMFITDMPTAKLVMAT